MAIPVREALADNGIFGVIVSEEPLLPRTAGDPGSKVESYLDGSDAFVALCTPDDRLDDGTVQCRQNVIDEIRRASEKSHLRYRILAFKEASVALPSNINLTYEALDVADVNATAQGILDQLSAWGVLDSQDTSARDDAQGMVAARRSKPNVLFAGFSSVPDQPITGSSIADPSKAEFVRVLFVNEPEVRSPEANISDLHARIEVRNTSGSEVLLIVRDGRWAENPDRGTGLGRDTKSVDMPCTGETRTLDIAMRPYGENNCYGWDHSGRMIAHPSIPTGECHVHVELDGSNMDKRYFRFVLENPLGADANGVIEDSWIKLREMDGFTNPSTADRLDRPTTGTVEPE